MTRVEKIVVAILYPILCAGVFYLTHAFMLLIAEGRLY